MYKAITVDDEKLIKKSISALVKSNKTGFEIVGEAKDGEEALKLHNEILPDLIITDIRMPKLGGLEFIKQVKAVNGSVKFIIISGYDEFEYAQTAIRYGVVDFLLKPIKPDQFLKSMEKVYRQISQEHVSSKQRSEGLWIIKSYAEILAEQIWLLEENQVNQTINRLHQEIDDLQIDKDVLRGMFEDLTIYLQGELAKHSEGLRNLEVFERTKPAEAMELYNFLKELSSTIISEIKKSRNIGHRNNILSAVHYIDANYMEENITLSEVAEMINMSPSYFSMEFKAEMGISFKQYLTKLKIEKAKELLNNPLYKTYEIAYDIGYSDYPHFTKTFKKHIGMTPTQYRKTIGIG